MKGIYFNEATIVDENVKKAMENENNGQKKRAKTIIYRECYYD